MKEKNWKLGESKQSHETKTFHHPTEYDESDDLEAVKRYSVSEELMHEIEPLPEPKTTVYDGWFWNGHLNKFERWKEHISSLKSTGFKEWYKRGG